jgi:hypothetical protein
MQNTILDLDSLMDFYIWLCNLFNDSKTWKMADASEHNIKTVHNAVRNHIWTFIILETLGVIYYVIIIIQIFIGIAFFIMLYYTCRI